MKNFYTLAAAALLFLAGPAHALSVEQGATNSDGTSKFSDPDEQTPPGLTAPNPSANFSANMNQPSVNAPSVPQMMGVDQGRSSFDHAYNHVTNQNQ